MLSAPEALVSFFSKVFVLLPGSQTKALKDSVYPAIPSPMRVTNFIYWTIEVLFSERDLNFRISKTRSAHVHKLVHRYAPVSHSAFQSLDAYRSHAPRNRERYQQHLACRWPGSTLEKLKVNLFRNDRIPAVVKFPLPICKNRRVAS